jgi:hypothetical protein
VVFTVGVTEDRIDILNIETVKPEDSKKNKDSTSESNSNKLHKPYIG